MLETTGFVLYFFVHFPIPLALCYSGLFKMNTEPNIAPARWGNHCS